MVIVCFSSSIYAYHLLLYTFIINGSTVFCLFVKCTKAGDDSDSAQKRRDTCNFLSNYISILFLETDWLKLKATYLKLIHKNNYQSVPHLPLLLPYHKLQFLIP